VVTRHMRAVNGSGKSKGMPAEMAAAMTTLCSVHFFSLLRGVMQGLGLAGWEVQAGLGAYLVGVSRFQSYPLRVQIQERTQGTAAYIVRKVEKLLLPQSVVTITPALDKEWARLAGSSDDKVVFIPEWETITAAGTAEIEVQRSGLTKRIPIKAEGRVVEQVEKIEGRFACISVDRPFRAGPHLLWLSIRQPDQQQKGSGFSSHPTDGDISMWCALQKLLQERARLPIFLPEWEQVVAEEICERDVRAVHHIPGFLQTWRTMCLIRSFQFEKNTNAESLQATFEDLAVATLLAKRVFRESCWFPSPQKIFDRLGKASERTAVIHPVSGKPVVYESTEEQEPNNYQSVLDWGSEKK
jgi:hypothetical protein